MTIMVAFGLSLPHSSLGIGHQNEIVRSFIRQETKDYRYFNLEVSHVEGGLAAPTPISDIWFFLWNLLLYLLKHYILHVHANLDWLACWPPLSYYNGKGKFELRSDSKHRGDHHSQSPPLHPTIQNFELWVDLNLNIYSVNFKIKRFFLVRKLKNTPGPPQVEVKSWTPHPHPTPQVEVNHKCDKTADQFATFSSTIFLRHIKHIDFFLPKKKRRYIIYMKLLECFYYIF